MGKDLRWEEVWPILVPGCRGESDREHRGAASRRQCRQGPFSHKSNQQSEFQQEDTWVSLWLLNKGGTAGGSSIDQGGAGGAVVRLLPSSRKGIKLAWNRVLKMEQKTREWIRERFRR